MSDNLYNISSNLMTVIEGGIVVDEDTGEVLFDADNVEALELQLADKLEAITVVSDNKMARAQFLRTEAKRFIEAAKQLEAQAKSLGEYAVKCVEPFGKLETDHYVLSTRTTEAVDVLDMAEVPLDYLRKKVDVTVDKTKVKAALKAGESVPGCALVKNVHLVVK